uniref:Pectinesterase inhibitor domain-containing protein n=1 Tax=Ananas comosus var. bracteatus TaxID=296719 RepID=A0A6V7P4D1_ANACO|nr:unnamed protein product [Ananas comosus var. bracteatus]
MKSIILFGSALVLILRNSALASASLEDTCKKVQAEDPDANYEFCVTSLQVVPESRTANLSQLTIITTQLSIKNYTHALDVIAQLLKNHSLSHLQREVLETCQEEYNLGWTPTNKQSKMSKLVISSALCLASLLLLSRLSTARTRLARARRHLCYLERMI